MLKRRGHAFQHTPINVHGATGYVQPHLLANFFGGLADNTVQALGYAFKLHHARAQQVALQFAGLTPLRNQVVFCAFHGALQIALNCGNVIDGFGHHPGKFLHPCEAVKFQRVKLLRSVFDKRHARLHLRLGLHLNITQLTAKAVQIARQINQRPAQLAQPGSQS